MIFQINSRKLFYLAALSAIGYSIVSCTAADPKQFGILVSTLDGSNVQRILSDPHREINHARVSPDKKWITFTRYNKRGLNGLAKEIDGYMDTEIMLARMDGSELQSLVSPRKDKVAANGYWTEDGKAILYVSDDNPLGRGQINRIELDTRIISKVILDDDLWAADPHPVKGQMAISVFDPKERVTSIWMATDSGGKAHRITFPNSWVGMAPPPWATMIQKYLLTVVK